MKQPTKYDVFISYSRKDYVDKQKNVIPGNIISKIIKALNDASITYWIDEKGIYSGDEFSGIIADAIENSSALVFVSSESSNNSTWTIGEIATAQEANKKIIPVRIDSSRYHKSLRVRLNALDYINFTSNPEKGTQDLVKAIRTHLEQIEAEKRKIEEEEQRKREAAEKEAEELRQQKEREKKRRLEEQERLISEIKLSCTALNNEEAKLELERENLLLKLKNVTDDIKGEELKSLIQTSGAINKKIFADLKLEVNHLKEDKRNLELNIDSLQATIKERDGQICKLQRELQQANSQISELEADKCNKSDSDNDTTRNRSNLKTHSIYGIIIAILLIILIYNLWGSSQTKKQQEANNHEATAIDSQKSNEEHIGKEKEDSLTEFDKGKEYYNSYYHEKPGERDTRNLQSAFLWWKKSADHGLAEAQDSVGMCYYYGRGVDKDYENAIVYFSRSAEQGCADAAYWLGLCYYYGNTSGSDHSSKNVDKTKALQHFSMAAKDGHSGGLCYTGICYYNKGIDSKSKSDYNTAYKYFEESYNWLIKAEDAGSKKALYYLGLHYHTGNSNRKDRVKAFDYFKNAAEKGETDAQFYTGLYYENGYGNVPKDHNIAMEWFRKSAKGGNSEAKKKLESYNNSSFIIQ